MGRLRSALILVVALTALSPSAVTAQEGDEATARALFEEAKERIRAGELAAARDLLERSLELSPNPASAFNLAVVLRAMGRAVEAGDYLEALSGGRFGELTAREEAEIERLSSQVDEEVARIVLTTEAVGAVRASIDGDGVGVIDPSTEATRRVDPGDHVVEAWTEDGRHFREELSVVRGDYRTIALAFPDAPATGDDADTGTTVFESPWFWVITGVVVAAGVAVTVVLATTASPDRVEDPVWGSGMTLLSF
jgi:hypothetical protein